MPHHDTTDILSCNRKSVPARYAGEPMHILHAMRAALARYGIDPDEPDEPSDSVSQPTPAIDWPSLSVSGPLPGGPY